ncbi:hypothetical protein [Georgenia sp. SYP-B2076]|uniref:hypothetical protein n=1 Tax=Georgenia sp. SYP-B2076 TaxID=2495881 RepID=UPI000F8F7C67|nr:hypothetical protein [Georgenia sp. SYP-B2076]
MILSRRGSRAPKDVIAHLPKSDNVMAAAELADGSWALVTAGVLVLADTSGVRGRHPWHEVQHGRWDGDVRQFTVTWVDGARRPLVLTTLTDEVEPFTSALRERVQSSVVHTESRDMPGGATAQVLIRRGEDGELLSQLTVTGPIRGDDEERRLVDELEQHARSAVGLDT